jgi:hypothetical protein
MDDTTVSPGPTPNTIRAADGTVLTAPEGWALPPPEDAGLTRGVKRLSSEPKPISTEARSSS